MCLKNLQLAQSTISGNTIKLPWARSDSVLFGNLTILGNFTISPIFPVRKTMKSRKFKVNPIITCIHRDKSVSLYVRFLLLSNPVARMEQSTLWMKPQTCLGISWIDSSTNSSRCWCLTPAITEFYRKSNSSVATFHFCLVTRLEAFIKEQAAIGLVLITGPNFSSLLSPSPPQEVYHFERKRMHQFSNWSVAQLCPILCGFDVSIWNKKIPLLCHHVLTENM